MSVSRRQIAVALGYDGEQMHAPKVLAKGGGFMAERILEIAKEQGIPIQKDESLAASLHQLDLGTIIPEELYAVVAELLAFMMKMEQSQKSV